MAVSLSASLHGCYPQLASKAFLIQLASATYQCRNRAPSCISFRRIATMLIGVLITPGAPRERSPCIRQRPFVIAGD